MNRARKDVDESAVSINVQVFLFDLMQLNGKTLLHVPFRHRDELMRSTFSPMANRLDFVEARRFSHEADDGHDAAAVREFLHASFGARCEGIMVKVLGPALVDVGVSPDDALQRIVAQLPPPELTRLHEDIDFRSTRQAAALRLDEALKAGPAKLSTAAGAAAGATAGGKAAAKRPKAGSAAAKRQVDAEGEEGEEVHRSGVNLALSTYQPSKRCENWLKVRRTGSFYLDATSFWEAGVSSTHARLNPTSWLQVKKDYVEGMTDTLDLVVVGAWWGNGRKAGWFSPFLLACYNPETEQLETVCKVCRRRRRATFKKCLRPTF
jgi:DNA ligase-1